MAGVAARTLLRCVAPRARGPAVPALRTGQPGRTALQAMEVYSLALAARPARESGVDVRVAAALTGYKVAHVGSFGCYPAAKSQ